MYKRSIDGIHPDAMQMLLTNSWKGNVREFQNIIERAVVTLPWNSTYAE